MQMLCLAQLVHAALLVLLRSGALCKNNEGIYEVVMVREMLTIQWELAACFMSNEQLVWMVMCVSCFVLLPLMRLN